MASRFVSEETWTLPFAGELKRAASKEGSFLVQAGNNTVESAYADIPTGTKAMFHLLVDRARRKIGRHDQRQVGDPSYRSRYPPYPLVLVPLKSCRKARGHSTLLDLPVGRTDVSVALEFPARLRGVPAESRRWWLCAESPLAEGELALEFRDPLRAAQAQPLPLPLSYDHPPRRRSPLPELSDNLENPAAVSHPFQSADGGTAE